MGGFIAGQKLTGAFINGNKQAGAFIAGDKVGFGVNWKFDLILFYRKVGTTTYFIKDYTKKLGNMLKVDTGYLLTKAWNSGNNIYFAMNNSIYKMDLSQNTSIGYSLISTNAHSTLLAGSNAINDKAFGVRYVLFKTNDHKFTCYDSVNNTISTSIAGATTFGAMETYADFSEQDTIFMTSTSNNKLMYKYTISTNTLTTNLIDTTSYYKFILRFKDHIILHIGNSALNASSVRVYSDVSLSSYTTLYSLSVSSIRMYIVGDHLVLHADSSTSLRFYDAQLNFVRAITINNAYNAWPVRNLNVLVTSDGQLIFEDGSIISNKLKTKLGALKLNVKSFCYADGWLYFISWPSNTTGQHVVQRYNIVNDILETVDTLTDEYASLTSHAINDYPQTVLATLPS